MLKFILSFSLIVGDVYLSPASDINIFNIHINSVNVLLSYNNSISYKIINKSIVTFNLGWLQPSQD